MKLNLIVSVIIILGILFYLNKKTLLEGFTDAPSPAHTEEVADIMSDLTRFKNTIASKRSITLPTATEDSSVFTSYFINLLPVINNFSVYTTQISRMDAIRDDLDEETVEDFEELLEDTDNEFLQLVSSTLNTMKLFHQAGAEIFNQMVVNYVEFLSTNLPNISNYSSSSLRFTIQNNLSIVVNAINSDDSSTPSPTITSPSPTITPPTPAATNTTNDQSDNIDENLDLFLPNLL